VALGHGQPLCLRFVRRDVIGEGPTWRRTRPERGLAPEKGD